MKYQRSLAKGTGAGNLGTVKESCPATYILLHICVEFFVGPVIIFELTIQNGERN